MFLILVSTVSDPHFFLFMNDPFISFAASLRRMLYHPKPAGLVYPLLSKQEKGEEDKRMVLNLECLPWWRGKKKTVELLGNFNCCMYCLHCPFCKLNVSVSIWKMRIYSWGLDMDCMHNLTISSQKKKKMFSSFHVKGLLSTSFKHTHYYGWGFRTRMWNRRINIPCMIFWPP